MDSSRPGQRMNTRGEIRPEGPNNIEHRSKIVPGSAGVIFNTLFILFCPSLLFVIPLLSKHFKPDPPPEPAPDPKNPAREAPREA